MLSRYYSPKTGRFLNADAFASTGQGLLGNNMFAYCNNNPISQKDSTGQAIETIIDIASLTVSICDVINDPTNGWAWAGVVGDLIDMVPFLTGVGEGVKGLRAAKAIDTALEVADGFGGLSKAAKYGIDTYNNLRKAIKGTGLEAHHIIEQRFLKSLGKSTDNALSVAVTVNEHQQFTSAWRKLVPYGTNYSTLSVDDIWGYAQEVYSGYPDLLQAAWDTLYS